MDNVRRFPLLVPNERVRVPRNFRDILMMEKVRTGEILRTVPSTITAAEVRGWPQLIDEDVLQTHRGNEAVVNAVTGLRYCMLAPSVPLGSRAFIGALGQIRLTQALTILPHRERADLLYLRGAKQYTFGAWAVAVLAASLTKVGASCMLPLAVEDAGASIDLFCNAGSSLGALQVKPGPWRGGRVGPESREKQLEFWQRVQVYNDRNGKRCIPVWTEVDSVNVNPLQGHYTRDSVRFSRSVLALLGG